MSRVAKCIDNGPMKGFWGIIKRERYYSRRFTDKNTFVSMIEDYIEYYNNKRLHRNLDVLTPMEKHSNYLLDGERFIPILQEHDPLHMEEAGSRSSTQ